MGYYKNVKHIPSNVHDNNKSLCIECVSWPSGQVHRTQVLVLFQQQSVGSNLGCQYTCALDCRLPNCFKGACYFTRQALIPIPTSLLTVLGGNPVSAPGVGGSVTQVAVGLVKQP